MQIHGELSWKEQVAKLPTSQSSPSSFGTLPILKTKLEGRKHLIPTCGLACATKFMPGAEDRATGWEPSEEAMTL